MSTSTQISESVEHIPKPAHQAFLLPFEFEVAGDIKLVFSGLGSLLAHTQTKDVLAPCPFTFGICQGVLARRNVSVTLVALQLIAANPMRPFSEGECNQG